MAGDFQNARRRERHGDPIITSIMRHAAASPATRSDNGERTATRPVIVVGLLLLVGLAIGVSWFRPGHRPAAASASPIPQADATPGLSEATLAVLERLTVPVEIRFYSVLNESEAAAPRRAHAARVRGLLHEYEQAGNGRILVRRIESGVESAAANGLLPLRLGREINFLGIVVASQGQTAVLPSLAPEWEAALEFDLSRAIAHVAAGSPGGGQVIFNPQPAMLVSTDELLAAVPEVAELSLIEAALKVKAIGLEEFKTTAAEIQTELAVARQQLAAAQQEGPEAERLARDKLGRLQGEQNDRLSEISRRMEGRLAALQHLKRSSP